MKSSRRNFIKKSAVVSGVLTMGIPHFNILKAKALKDEVIGHSNYKYRIHKSWGDLDPKKAPIQHCHEMVMDSKGRLLMLTDLSENNVIIYDKSGKLLDNWTLNLQGGHGLTLFKEGEKDVLFITYCIADRARVVKTDLKGNILMTLSHPKDIGVYKETQQYAPTETAIAPNGDIYVADGYGSSYILQFDKEGEFIRKFAGKGDGGFDGKDDKDENLKTAHGIAIDNRDPNNLSLICTSRKQNCFKRFTLDGQYISTIHLPGAYICRAVIDDENIYSGVCWSRLKYTDLTYGSGFVTILDKENKVISNPGGTEPFYHNGELQLMKQDQALFKHCHDVCVDEDKNLYVCQWNADYTYPIKLERV